MYTRDFTAEFEMLPQLLIVRTVVDILDKHASLIAVIFGWFACLTHIVGRVLLLLRLLVVLIYRKSVRRVNQLILI